MGNKGGIGMDNKRKYLIIGGLIGVTLITGVALALLYKSQQIEWDEDFEGYL